MSSRRRRPVLPRKARCLTKRPSATSMIDFESSSETSLSSNSDHSISSVSSDGSASNTDTEDDTFVARGNAARKPVKNAGSGDKKSVKGKGKKSDRKSRSPRTKKKKYAEPESILKEVPLKPPNTKFATSEKANSSSLYQSKTGQKVEFSPENVVCTFGTSQYLSKFKKKLAQAKEKFDSSAPFPPGSKGQSQTTKSILKK